jgi:quinoprotein glucose dehydrogenase
VRRALIQPTKRGEIFVLDRETGAAIKTVQELAVPQGGIAPGDRLSPTQPFSTGMPSFRGALLRG